MLAVLAIAWAPFDSVAAQRPADQACAVAARNINLLIDSAKVMCLSPMGGERTLILVTESAFFDKAPIRDAYLAVVVAAAADAIRKHPAAKIVTVSIMDFELGRKRMHWTISAADAMRWQQEVRTERITQDQFIAGLKAAGRTVSLPPKK